jgi:hypothetical protein
MVDNNEGNFVSKDDLQVLMAQFTQKMADQQTEFAKQLDIQANKIHSSYAKKLKNLPSSSLSTEEVNEEAPEGAQSRKPTKRELELQDNVEKLVSRLEESDKKARLATQKSSFTDHALKAGFDQTAIDTLWKLQSANNAFVDDGENGFRMKVVHDGVEVALPLDSAMSKLANTPEAKFFLAPKGIGGSGGTKPQDIKTKSPTKSPIEVDWGAIGAALVTPQI